MAKQNASTKMWPRTVVSYQMNNEGQCNESICSGVAMYIVISSYAGTGAFCLSTSHGTDDVIMHTGPGMLLTLGLMQ